MPRLPKSAADIRIWESAEAVEGSQEQAGLRCVDEDGSVASQSVLALGWGRWKKVYLAWATLSKGSGADRRRFKDENGTFGEPVYTVPDADDPDPGADGEA